MNINAITDLESVAKRFSDARKLLAHRKQVLDDQCLAAERRLIGGIRSAFADAVAARAELEDALKKHRAEFAQGKKRTLTIHGIKLGFAQSKPAVEIDNEARTIALIEKHLKDQADVLIATKKSLVKKALANLDAKDLRQIGASLTAATDEIVIKSTDDDLDKIVDALLKRATTTEEEAA